MPFIAQVALVCCNVTSGKTSAPGYLTEAELIGVMEQSGIGTDASIATHIENICKRNYVEVGSGRTMVPTDLGVMLVQGYRAIDPDLVEPTVRSYVERQLDTIASGKQDLGTVVSHVLAQFMAKFRYFVAHIGEMEELFEASMGQSAAGPAERALVKCGRTGLYLQLQPKARPPRLYNRQTEEVYRLPLGGSIKSFNGKLCPLDGFELCLYTTGGRSYPLCPNCFNYPPASIGGVLGAPQAVDSSVGDPHDASGSGSLNLMDDPELLDAGKEDMLAELKRAVDIDEPDFDESAVGGGGGGGSSSATSLCLRCPMSELHPAVEPFVVCACPDTAETGGALILDPTGGPQWKLISTQCSYMIMLPPGAHRVRVLPDADEATGRRYLELVFNKNRSPLGPDDTKYTGLLGEGLFDLEAGLLTQIYGKGGPRRNGGGAANRGRGRGRGRGNGTGRGGRRGS
jgi:DNA topoisomerase-3